MSALLDRVLGYDPKDHDKPDCEAWYRPAQEVEHRTQATADAAIGRCVRRHDLALKARYEGRTDGRLAMASMPDPDFDRESRPVPLTDRQSLLLAVAVLWSLAILFASFLVGFALGLVVSGVAVAWFSYVAGRSAWFAFQILRHGEEY